jgi:hypothetical protein
MIKASIPSDTISFKEISTGHNSAGNGGDGYNYGAITNNPTIYFQPYNQADGASVHVKTGDHVDQKAYWEAGGSNPKNEYLPKTDYLHKADGGYSQSNGDQHSYSGYDTSNVSADTNAYQTNWLAADMSQNVAAGIGGYGGSGNYAVGGNVNVDLTSVLSETGSHHVSDHPPV